MIAYLSVDKIFLIDVFLLCLNIVVNELIFIHLEIRCDFLLRFYTRRRARCSSVRWFYCRLKFKYLKGFYLQAGSIIDFTFSPRAIISYGVPIPTWIVQNWIDVVHSIHPLTYYDVYYSHPHIILCYVRMNTKRVGWNYYFRKNTRATGAPVENRGDPVTRLCGCFSKE